jgi:hypothetical protein
MPLTTRKTETVGLSIDHRRYHRFMAGEAKEEIARKDGLAFEEVHRSIQAGERLEFTRLLQQFLGLRFEAAINNEKLRARILKRLGDTFIDGLRSLLSGKKTVIERNRNTGEIRFHKIVDPRLIAMGLEQFRKTIGLEERAAPVAVTILTSSMSDVEGAELKSRRSPLP